MIARIYRPAKTAMQSGKGRTEHWVLEYEPAERTTLEPLMGYVSSRDMMSQVRLQFDTSEEAVRYAERNDIEYRLIEPKPTRRRTMSYAENFSTSRFMPWTH